MERLGKALADPVFAGKIFILIGHTDKRGTEPYNLRLSEQRAEMVKQFLARLCNISANRLQTRGRGETALLYPGDGEAEHTLNRRVEVRAGFPGGVSKTDVPPGNGVRQSVSGGFRGHDAFVRGDSHGPHYRICRFNGRQWGENQTRQ